MLNSPVRILSLFNPCCKDIVMGARDGRFKRMTKLLTPENSVGRPETHTKDCGRRLVLRKNGENPVTSNLELLMANSTTGVLMTQLSWSEGAHRRKIWPIFQLSLFVAPRW
jgi:hypothetical protein